MLTKELIQGKTISIDWQFTAPVEDHDNNWCEWMVTGTGSDGNTYSGNCQADRTDPEGCHDNEVTNIDFLFSVKGEIKVPVSYDKAEQERMIATVTSKLLEHGIEVKIRNFAEFEGATQMLNRIEHETNYK